MVCTVAGKAALVQQASVDRFHMHQSKRPGQKQCSSLYHGKFLHVWELGDGTQHCIAVLHLGLECGDVVVRGMRKGMLLILRECNGFYEILGTGFVSLRGRACVRGPVRHCHGDAARITNTFAYEIEILVNEVGLWSFVGRE